MRKSKTAAIRIDWLNKTEALILAEHPHVAGRIKWVELIHLFNVGCTPEDACSRYSFHVIIESARETK